MTILQFIKIEVMCSSLDNFTSFRLTSVLSCEMWKMVFVCSIILRRSNEKILRAAH